MASYSVQVTNTPAIKNAPLIGLAEGNGYFSNLHLAGLILGVPWIVKRTLPVVSYGGFKTYLFLVALLGVPVAIAYWTLMSMYGPRKNQKVQLPGRSIEEYITIKDPELKAKYFGKEKIPMQVFHDAYFDDKVEFNGMSFILTLLPTTSYNSSFFFSFFLSSSLGDVLDILESRHDWAKMVFTPELFKYVLTQFLPEVIIHSKSQDEEQVRDHYDRTSRVFTRLFASLTHFSRRR